MAAAQLSVGTLGVEGAWEVRTQATLLAPVRELNVPLARQAATLPRANLLISRRPAQGVAPAAALAQVTSEAAAAIPGFKTALQGVFTFADGVEGASASVAFGLSSGLRVLQQHVARVDDGILTCLVATAHDSQKDQLDELVAMARSFSPAA